ncbi:bacteriohemerythrin [Candidatus Latescibacterota bacterium]
MTLLLWDESLHVNIKEIDIQHENLFNIINNLHDNFINNSADDVIRPVLNSLLEFLIVHYATEEKWMKKYKYPELELHKQKHQEFVSNIKNFVSEYKKNKTSLPTKDILISLAGWHSSHIVEYDKKFGKFLKNIIDK